MSDPRRPAGRPPDQRISTATPVRGAGSPPVAGVGRHV